jgi:hypothetical protein
LSCNDIKVLSQIKSTIDNNNSVLAVIIIIRIKITFTLEGNTVAKRKFATCHKAILNFNERQRQEVVGWKGKRTGGRLW